MKKIIYNFIKRISRNLRNLLKDFIKDMMQNSEYDFKFCGHIKSKA